MDRRGESWPVTLVNALSGSKRTYTALGEEFDRHETYDIHRLYIKGYHIGIGGPVSKPQSGEPETMVGTIVPHPYVELHPEPIVDGMQGILSQPDELFIEQTTRLLEPPQPIHSLVENQEFSVPVS